MSRARPLDLERLRHVPGELLRTRDVRDQVAADLELLWWHQRAVHGAVGAVRGLEAGAISGGGAVAVTPGLGYDARGRELVLLRGRTIAMPTGTTPMTLLARRREGACEAELAWRPTARLDACDGFALGSLDPDATPSFRPATRAPAVARPRIGFGATPPAGTAWEPWTIGGGRLPFVLGVQVRVDTGAAGFTTPPCYFAWLQWPRLLEGGLPARAFPAFGLQHLRDESIAGFTFAVAARVGAQELRALLALGSLGEALVGFARAQELHVCWLGIQANDDATTGP